MPRNVTRSEPALCYTYAKPESAWIEPPLMGELVSEAVARLLGLANRDG
jgi:hypothetical protein